MGKLGDTLTISEASASTRVITGKKCNIAMCNRQGVEGLMMNVTDTMERPWTEPNLNYFRGAEDEIVSRLVCCIYCSL